MAGKKFTQRERDVLSSVVHYEQTGYMRALEKPVCKMKGLYLKSMLDRTNQYLGKQWLEPEKRKLFEGIRKKIVAVLEKREKDLKKVS